MTDPYVAYIITDDFKSVKVQLPGESISSSPEYPSDWFKENPKQKPPVTIPGKIEDEDTWSKMLGNALEDVVSPSVAVRFLYEYVADENFSKLTQDWISYGVLIGKKDDVVNSTDILENTIDEYLPVGKEGPVIDEDGKKRLFFILIAGYRYGLASEILQGDYRASILGKINTVLKEKPYNLDSDLTATELGRCKQWYTNTEFRCLIAALHMFWIKFPESESAKLRNSS